MVLPLTRPMPEGTAVTLGRHQAKGFLEGWVIVALSKFPRLISDIKRFLILPRKHTHTLPVIPSQYKITCVHTQVHTHKITRIYSLIHKALPYHCLADFISEEEAMPPFSRWEN